MPANQRQARFVERTRPGHPCIECLTARRGTKSQTDLGEATKHPCLTYPGRIHLPFFLSVCLAFFSFFSVLMVSQGSDEVSIPVMRPEHPSTAASVVSDHVSDASSFVPGTVFLVDGWFFNF